MIDFSVSFRVTQPHLLPNPLVHLVVNGLAFLRRGFRTKVSKKIPHVVEAMMEVRFIMHSHSGYVYHALACSHVGPEMSVSRGVPFEVFLIGNLIIDWAFGHGAFCEVLHPFNARAVLDPFFAVITFSLVQAIFVYGTFTPPPANQLFETESLQPCHAWLPQMISSTI